MVLAVRGLLAIDQAAVEIGPITQSLITLHRVANYLFTCTISVVVIFHGIWWFS